MKVKEIDGFEIHFEALPEHHYSYEGWDESDIKETKEKLDNFELVLFCAKVSAHREGIELASDYLGGCFYKSEEEFYNTEGCYFDDMCNTVISEAKEQIETLQTKQTTYYLFSNLETLRVEKIEMLIKHDWRIHAFDGKNIESLLDCHAGFKFHLEINESDYKLLYSLL